MYLGMKEHSLINNTTKYPHDLTSSEITSPETTLRNNSIINNYSSGKYLPVPIN